jgi:hypothetical protein
VSELARVLRPGGCFLVDLGGGPRGEWRAIFRRVGEELDIREPQVGLTDAGALDELLGGLGATRRTLPPVLMRRRRPLADALEELAGQIHAWTWTVPAPAMQSAVATTRQWAWEQFGDLDEPRDVETVITWRAYDWA